ncbi:MAG: endolytic transglycosylase MltG [Cytophagales bacterium]|nr:endolytic transglycosylase MltG [Cytophagales bacterium]
MASRPSFDWKIGLFITIAFLLITFTFYFYQVTQTPNLQVDKPDTYVYIPTGATYATVMDSLKARQIIQDELSFSFLAKLLKYQERVRPGRYRISQDMGNLRAIRMLRAGLQEPVKVTFNNVRLKEDLPPRICRNGGQTGLRHRDDYDHVSAQHLRSVLEHLG